MLVLSRQRDEAIMIGDEVEITVVDIRGDKIRLGITAPSRVVVHRKEVYEAIRSENQVASQCDTLDLGLIAPAQSRKSAAKAVLFTPVQREQEPTPTHESARQSPDNASRKEARFTEERRSRQGGSR